MKYHTRGMPRAECHFPPILFPPVPFSVSPAHRMGWGAGVEALRVHLRNCIFFDDAAVVMRKDFRDEIARLQARLSRPGAAPSFGIGGIGGARGEA